MKRFLIAAAFTVFAFSAFALPGMDAVQAEIDKGNYTHAEQMMREVLATTPGSARAHYIYAQILAHDRHFERAAEEAAQARRIDLDLSFTQADKFTAFERLLAREQGASGGVAKIERAVSPVVREQPAPARASGYPGWLWGAVGFAMAFLAWRAFSARQAASAGGSLVPATPGASGAFGGHAPGPAPLAPAVAAGSGHGLLGTGLALAGGVAAGMLAEKLFEAHREPGLGALAHAGSDALIPGMFDEPRIDDSVARELEQRPIDLGSGDGWGGADADAGVSSDADGW